MSDKRIIEKALSSELERLKNYREKLQDETESLLWNLTAPQGRADNYSGTTFEIVEFLRSSLTQQGDETCPACGQTIHAKDSGRNLPSRIRSLDQEIIELNVQIGAEMDRLNELERGALAKKMVGKSRSIEEIQREITASEAILQKTRLQNRPSNGNTRKRDE